jgi:hypothetical protein
MARTYSKGIHTDVNKDFRAKSQLTRPRVPPSDKARLGQFRVIQRDLVYVIGIPVEIADEEILGRYEYFGQYGSVKKIVVNNQASHAGGFQRPTVSAYVTFSNIEDAGECIYALENFSLGSHPIKASFGTSKYCSSYLSGQKCNNPECMYLHYTGTIEDSFTTDEIQQNSPRFADLTRPVRPPDYWDFPFQNDKPTKFPARRIFTKEKTEQMQMSGRMKVEEEETVTERVETTEEKEKTRREFLDTLSGAGLSCAEPLKVDYTVGKSLCEQFDLNTPTIRSVFWQMTRSNQ